MIPRHDPETVPISHGIQFLKRQQTDDYGVERKHYKPPYRPMATRNGLPMCLYEYRGTGHSMSLREAEYWLTGTINEANYCTICDD